MEERIQEPLTSISFVQSLAALREAVKAVPQDVRDACTIVLDNPSFQRRPASETKHHVYPGGLVVHTAEVLDFALRMAGRHAYSVQILIPATIFHDFMKIRDYDLEGKKTWYREHIRHVAGSYAEWVSVANQFHIPMPMIDEVGHCILAHHGRQEWGSPIEPQTFEAHCLHYADMLSVEFGAGARLS